MTAIGDAAGLLLVAVLTGLSGCSTPTSFACSGDEQCRLGGEAGVCTSMGRCAYPDQRCTSGLRYPAGAPSGLGGDCAEGDGVAPGTESDASSSEETTVDPPTSSSTTGFDTTEPESESDTISTGPDPSTTQPDPSEGDTGDPLCEDPYPNDDPFIVPATVLPECEGEFMETFDEQPGFDWFRFSSTEQCSLGPPEIYRAAGIDAPGEVCVFGLCSGLQEVVCTNDGQGPVVVDALTGCCADAGGGVGVWVLGCEGLIETFVRVGPLDGVGQACDPYVLSVFAQ